MNELISGLTKLQSLIWMFPVLFFIWFINLIRISIKRSK
jgi:hypothetical protein